MLSDAQKNIQVVVKKLKTSLISQYSCKAHFREYTNVHVIKRHITNCSVPYKHILRFETHKSGFTSFATLAQLLDPTTMQLMSPPSCFAAVMAWRVTGLSFSLLCSASTRVLWLRYNKLAGEDN